MLWCYSYHACPDGPLGLLIPACVNKSDMNPDSVTPASLIYMNCVGWATVGKLPSQFSG